MIFKNKKGAYGIGIAVYTIIALFVIILDIYYKASKEGLLISIIFLIGLLLLILLINNKGWFVYKKAGFIVLIVFLTIGAISYIYSLTPPDDKFMGLIEGMAKSIASVADSGFKWMFGSSFMDAAKKISGIRTGADFFNHFLLSLYFGAAASFLMFLGSLIAKKTGMSIEKKIFSIGRLSTLPSNSASWLDTISGSLNRMIIFTLVYATLMQIGIINRIIEFITFYRMSFFPYFQITNWFIYPFILAIYFGYAPEIIAQISRYYYYQKLQKVVMLTKAGIRGVRSVGKT